MSKNSKYFLEYAIKISKTSGFTSSRTQTQYITATSHFPCWGVDDDSVGDCDKCGYHFGWAVRQLRGEYNRRSDAIVKKKSRPPSGGWNPRDLSKQTRNTLERRQGI